MNQPFPEEELMKAKEEIESKTCIRVQEAQGNEYHVRIINGQG